MSKKGACLAVVEVVVVVVAVVIVAAVVRPVSPSLSRLISIFSRQPNFVATLYNTESLVKIF